MKNIQIVSVRKAKIEYLEKAIKGKDKKLAKGAKIILEDEVLLEKYLAAKIVRRKKLKKQNTKSSIWSKYFGFLT